MAAIPLVARAASEADPDAAASSSGGAGSAGSTQPAGATGQGKAVPEKPTNETPPAAPPETVSQVTAGPYTVALDKTNWQAYDGLIRFTITSDVDPSLLKIVTACFHWDLTHPGKTPRCVTSPIVRLASENTPTQTARFAAKVPLEWSQSPRDAKSVIPFIPGAIFEVTIGRTDKTTDAPCTADLNVGITSKGISAFLTVSFLVLLWVVFSRFATDIRIPKTAFVLRLIAQPSGWASLGKLQILLWTAVVGAGAVFVMTLNGALIEISEGTLVLLGISGGAAIASQIKTKQETSPTPPPSPPSIRVQQLEAKLVDGGVMLTWNGPTLAPEAGAYTVQYQLGNAEWVTETSTVSAPRLLVVDLAPGNYGFRVCATNTAGSGVFSEIAKVEVRAAAEPAGPAASRVDLVGEPTADTVRFKLREPKEGRTYRLQYRRRDSDRSWDERNDEGGTFTIDRLQPDTLYTFRVVAHDARGYGPPTLAREVRTGRHLPRWSDLVTQTTRAPEIDVSRLQMLIFTVVSACFVVLNIWQSGVIPVIDSSYLLLMGISNGVYVGAKFLGSDT